MNHLRNLLLASLFTIFLPAILLAAPPSVEGHWEGSIDIPGSKLAIDVDLARSGESWTGDISIPAQRAKDLPLEKISVETDKVSFAIKGVPGSPTFNGTIAEDGKSIQGVFAQGGGIFKFSLDRAAAPEAQAAATLEGFSKHVEETIDAWHVPGVAIGIVKDDKVVLAKGYGFRDLDKKLPVTADTIFAIGSCTKAFTTFTMGTLVDEGKLSWDKPVRTWIPEIQLKDPYASDNITPRDMVTHRSGLPRHDLLWYNNNTWTRKEFVEHLRYLEPSAELREKWQYNNLMFLAAGYLVERVTGSSWENAVRTRILSPLGMTHTNFAVADSQKSRDYALPYRENDDHKIERIPFRVIDAVGPAGSINSTVDDMTKWLMVHLDGGKFEGKRLIHAATLETIHSPQMVTGQRSERPEISDTSYAMGWFVDTYRGHREIQHGGAIDGFIARVTLFPDDDLGIVVLTNSQNSLPTQFTHEAADRVLGLTPIDWSGQAFLKRMTAEKVMKQAEAKKSTARVMGTKPSHPIDDYVGVYHDNGYGDLEIHKSGDGLTMTYHDITVPLSHWHYDVFNAGKASSGDPTFEDMKFQFRTNVDGNIASVEAPFEPMVAPIVFHKKPDAKYSDPVFLAQLAGQYDLGTAIVTISVKGDALFADVPGQPTYELQPIPGDRFQLEGLQGFTVEFHFDAKGQPTEAVFYQPNGVFVAKRK